MRSNIRNFILTIVLLIFTVGLVYLLFGNVEVNPYIICIFIAGFVSALGYLIWGNLDSFESIKSKSKLILPNSRLDENPRIVFRESLKIFNEQLKTIQPSFEHAIYMIDPESDGFVLQDSAPEKFFDTINTKNKILKKIFSDDQALVIKPHEDREDWNDIIDFETTNDSYCMLGAKISFGSVPIGCLFALANDVRKVESQDQIIIKQIAQQITISLSIIDNIESLQNHNKILERINSITNSVNISESRTAIYEKVSAVCKSIFNYDKLSILLSYEDTDNTRVEYIDGYNLDISLNEVFSLEKSIFSKVINDGKIVNTSNIKRDFGKRYRFYEDENPQRKISTMLAIPISINDEYAGCIAIERFEEREYSNLHKFYLEKIAHILSTLLYWQADYHKMYLNTTVDNLTGLLNYHAFLKRLDIEMNRASRNENSLVIIIIDVDKFKRINDTFGHQIGNEALKQISNIISSSVRSIDVVARYGGEEFIVALTDSDTNNAEQIADRIVNNVANNIFIFKDDRVRITISAGLAEYPNDSDQVQKLIEAADKAMYNAKQHGGNTFSL